MCPDTPTPDQQGADRRGTPRPPRLLIIEDETRIAEFLLKGLTCEGFEVVVAQDGDVGLFLATSDRFDAIVLDLGLPGIGGLELLAQLRAAGVVASVVVLTGNDEPAVRRSVLAAGAAAYAAKPLRFRELCEILGRVIARR